jgi:hypothetical protein
MMKKLLLSLLVLCSIGLVKSFAGVGDTTVVQAFTFNSPQRAWFVFPSDTVNIEKILMLYTLKCNPAQFPECGEWDYLTNTYVYKHTGLIDSTMRTQNLYLVNGGNFSSFTYSNSPTYTHNTHWDYFINHLSTTSLNTYSVAGGNTNANHPFGAANNLSKSQYIWRASELTAAGMGAGNITGLNFYLQNGGSPFNKLIIRMKMVTADTLTAVTTNGNGFTTVYSKAHDFAPNAAGWRNIQLTNSFNWDGVSNLIIEVSFDNASTSVDNIVQSAVTSFKSGVTNASNDRTLKTHYASYVEVPVNPDLAAIDSFITVSFWAYGDAALQPMDGTTFEAVDSSGNRIINSHTPWSDSKVYWDAGNLGTSYDRISRSATAAQIKGQWNYWTFTKNCVTGSMKIFLNGATFFTGGGKTKIMAGIDKFRISKGTWNGSLAYSGRIDEFAVFNVDLPQATIQQFMNKKINTSHPNYNNLVAYYNFDDGNYFTAADASPMNHGPAYFSLGADNPLKSSAEINFGWNETNVRPNLSFEQGVYTSQLDSVFVLDSVMNPPTQIVSYLDTINNIGMPTDTMIVWPLGYTNFIYTPQGQMIDSTMTPADGTINQSVYTYYTYFPDIIRYEMGRYITPYGNGLSLGSGWTWTFDVSDYRTLLKDSVDMSAGNWQELLDVKFLFIEGTPPRDVLGIRNLWNGNFDYGIASNPIDNSLQALTVDLEPNAVNARWKSRVTGHGMDTPGNCAEFCPKNHFYKVNGTTRYTKLVWRDNCDYNPLYPQGGTWVYDRSNWCPGAEVWTYDWEISNFITPGTSFTLDHDVQAYTQTSGWDYYQIEDQLVSYGAPNFTNDVAIEDILAPTTNQMWMRKNPVCSSPTIKIKNTGSATLTSATITYGIVGAAPSVYNWTGSIAFMQSATLTLPNFNWIGGATKFYAYVSNPNGVTDQYAPNDTMRSNFVYPSATPATFVIELKTNSAPNENSYTVKDENGNIVLSRSNLAANTYYNDTLNLPSGCYRFELLDSGEDGLAWWANTAQGTGYVRFKNTMGNVMYNFNSDFGGQVYKQFTVGIATGEEEFLLTNVTNLNVYPNPSESMVYIDYNLTNRNDASIEVLDLMGKIIYSSKDENVTAGNRVVDMSEFSNGVYFVRLISGNQQMTKKLIIKK